MTQKTANTFDDIQEISLPKEVRNHPYLQAFAERMMKLSNRLNEIEDNTSRDDYDIQEDYLPAIREFIINFTGL